MFLSLIIGWLTVSCICLVLIFYNFNIPCEFFPSLLVGKPMFFIWHMMPNLLRRIVPGALARRFVCSE